MVQTFQANLDEQLFQHLLEELRDYAIFMIKPNGTIGTWNTGVKNLLGYDEVEFIGKPFSIIFTDEDVTLQIPEAELNRAKTKGRAEDERWHRKKDGNLFWANGSVTPIKDENNTVIGFAKVMRDQTPKKMLEEDLITQSNTLVAINKELAQFAGAVSHDLNVPLQTMRGFAHLLQEQEDLDEESKISVSHIIGGAEKMLRLVHELLEQSKGVSKVKLNLLETDAILKDVLLRLKKPIENSGAKISNDPLPPIWANETDITRIFQNLLHNAIKFRRKDLPPEIHISAKRAEKEIVFSISDNGTGVPVNKQKEIFSMFNRLDETVEGSGLGLAGCKKILERLNGRIWVESNAKGGATFYFTIPHGVPQESVHEKSGSLIQTH